MTLGALDLARDLGIRLEDTSPKALAQLKAHAQYCAEEPGSIVAAYGWLRPVEVDGTVDSDRFVHVFARLPKEYMGALWQHPDVAWDQLLCFLLFRLMTDCRRQRVPIIHNFTAKDLHPLGIAIPEDCES